MNYEIIINSIASIGVILSVIFLAYQIKKNTQASRANYYDSLNKTNMEFLRQLVENRELGELLEKATSNWDNLNEDDKRTSNYLFIQLFRHWENMFYQHKLSVLDKQLWTNHLNTMIGYFHHEERKNGGLSVKWHLQKILEIFLKKLKSQSKFILQLRI